MRFWGAILMASVALAGCDDGHLSRPYNERPGYESSKDIRPVKVDLYRYADMEAGSIMLLDRLLYDQFEIVDEPPLSFRFPDAYYDLRPNHKGGAQPWVKIHFDLDTMKPAPLASIVFPYNDSVDLTLTSKPSHERTPKEAAEFNRRYVVVTIENNRLEDGFWRHGALPSNAELARLTKARLVNGEDGAKDVGIVNGMRIVNYTKKSRSYPYPHVTPLYVEGIDINNNYIAAFPIELGKKKCSTYGLQYVALLRE